MNDQSAFKKINLQTIDIEKKADIFEQLNLPPEFAAFCRKNSQGIKVTAICIAVALTGWAGYDYYAASRLEKSTSFLAAAMEEVAEDLRVEKLAKVIDSHSGTDAALWSLVELAHTDLKNGRYKEAAARYREALASADQESPIVPLLHLSLAQACEQDKDTENAIKQYQALTGVKGFADMGYMALGRIYEQRGEAVKARDAYEKIENDQSGWSKERLANLIPPSKTGE